MQVPFIHRKLENQCTHQGINWNSDGYTKFQLWLHLWRFKVMLRIRRKEAFGEFSKQCPRWYCKVDYLGVFSKDGFEKLKRNFWYSFDKDLFKIDNLVYTFSELPANYVEWLKEKRPGAFNNQQKMKAS
jgi:hypothetical protein